MPVSGQQPSDGNGDRNRHGHSEHDLYGGLWTELGQGTRQTSAFIQQLRLLYQRSIRAREQAQPHRPETDDPCEPQYSEDEELGGESPELESDYDTPSTSGVPSALTPLQFLPPHPCSFLQPGLSLVGRQKLLQMGLRRREEDWQVHVRLQGVELARGYVCGTMEARNVPGSKSPIVTFWEGHIVDDNKYTFFTNTWGASKAMDLRHWGKFEGFAALRAAVVTNQGRCGALERHPFIYMRWKEQFFVNVGQDCGLTIAGFYYVCMCRQTGAVRGYYYDPSSSPFQELDLTVEQQPAGGYAFSGYSFRTLLTDTHHGTCSKSRMRLGCPPWQLHLKM
eukprot:jgi/Chrzof1/8832/Cz03g25340.t1